MNDERLRRPAQSPVAALTSANVQVMSVTGFYISPVSAGPTASRAHIPPADLSLPSTKHDRLRMALGADAEDYVCVDCAQSAV
jgi:hypothetical protein